MIGNSGEHPLHRGGNLLYSRRAMKKFFGFIFLFALACACKSVGAEIEAPRGGGVFVIPIKDGIEPALLYVIRRGTAEAREAHAAAVVFEMDTPGGTLGAAEEICREIQSLPMPSYTLVKKNAFSAGAIIALATKKIYMEPGSVIGDAMPIMIGLTGGVEAMPDDVKEKMVSGVCALIRANAQQNGYDAELAECMVRIDKEYAISNDFIKKEGQLLTLTNVEAEKPVGKDRKPLLSSGTVKDLGEMLGKVGLAGAEIHTLEVTAAEKIARWLAAIAPILMILGGLGLYVEFQTPGHIVPGILGVIFLALFFWGHHIAGLAGMEEVIIFAIGLGLIIVEIYVFPGHIFPGVIGVICVLLALFMAMIPHMNGVPNLPNAPAMPAPILPPWPDLRVPIMNLGLSIIGTGLGAILIARVLPHSRLASPLVLAHANRASAGYVSSESETSLVGQTGEAVSMLRPAGVAQFGARRIDVVTRGDFIQPGAKVRIVESQGNRIVVEAA